MPSHQRPKGLAAQRRKLRDKAISIAKELCRSKARCERCFRDTGQFQAAHILPEGFEITAADPENLLCLCPHCHRLSKTSWHQSPVHGVAWLNQTFPGRIEQLLWKVEHTKVIDWDSTLKQLRLLRDQVA